MMNIRAWKERASRVLANLSILSVAVRDSRTPWYAKALAVAVIAYAASPIDLIPDFIPVLGYLDDLLILPVAITITMRLIPAEVWEESRHRAMSATVGERRARLIAAAVVVTVWVLALVFFITSVVRRWAH